MDILANAFSMIQNAQKRRHKTVICPFSKLFANICHVLLKEGYIENYQIIQHKKHVPSLPKGDFPFKGWDPKGLVAKQPAVKGSQLSGPNPEIPNPGVFEICIFLRYTENKPSILTFSRVSKPGKRIYITASRLQKSYKNGLGSSILSTTKQQLKNGNSN